jgi:hypothetical protein
MFACDTHERIFSVISGVQPLAFTCELTGQLYDLLAMLQHLYSLGLVVGALRTTVLIFGLVVILIDFMLQLVPKL